MPLSGGWPDFGGIVDPRDNARIRLWLGTLAAAKGRYVPLPAPAQQPQYRTGCPACFLAMIEPDLGVDVEVSIGLNANERPTLCSHHQRAVADMHTFDEEALAAFFTGLRAWVTRAR